MAEIKKGVLRNGYIYNKNAYRLKGAEALCLAYAEKFIGVGNGFYANYRENERDLSVYIDIDNAVPDNIEKALKDSNGKGFNITTSHTAKPYELDIHGNGKGKLKVLESFTVDNWFMSKDGKTAQCKELVFVVTEMV